MCSEQIRKELKRLFVLLPRTGTSMPLQFVETGLLNCLSAATQMLVLNKYGIQTNILIDKTMPIDANRNKLVDAALQGKEFSDINGKKRKIKADYAFFMDTDQTFPPDTLFNLLDSMIENDLDCVSGMYFLKKPKFDPIFGRFVEPTHKHYRPTTYYPSEAHGCKPRLFEVDIVGMGCFLMNMRLFEKYDIQFPYFYYQKNPNTIYNDASEDMAFCQQLREKGCKIWIDPRVKCGHIGQVIVTENDYIQYRSVFEKSLGPRDKKLYWENIHDLRDEENEICPQLIGDDEAIDWVNKNLDRRDVDDDFKNK